MTRRYSQAEKGKRLAQPPEPPRLGRVKVPEFDNTDLVKKHALTLIGRVTNPKIQRMWSLIPFFMENWKTSSPGVGADLGHGKFQFQFATKEDMQLVLDNRPYHFAHWMIILQQWEQTVFEIWEITKAHAKMRVQINGLLPLLKTYTLEFANGDEVLATLVYEKLEKHCVKCGMLDHEESECPDLSLKQTEEVIPPPPARRIETPPTRASWDTSRTVTERRREEPHREENWRRSSRAVLSSDFQPQHNNNLQKDRWSNNSRHSSSQWERERLSSYKPGYRSNLSHRDFHKGGNPRWVETGRRIATSVLADNTSRSRSGDQREESLRERRQENERSRERRSGERRSGDTHTPQHNNTGRSGAESSQSRNHHQSGHQVTPIIDLPVAALTEAREEVREVMSQYANCADPTESAARKERMRLAEERGEFEDTAVQMVRHSIKSQNQIPEQTEEETLEPLMHERIPATRRLGPVLTDIHIEEEPARVPAKKRLGRPPNKKKIMPSSPPIPKKRRMPQLTGSPKRRLLMGSSSRKTPSKVPSKSKKQPSCAIIPAISKQRMDFHDPSSHLP
ncbi:unnamed protein product [Microthlaspi erraticum]|uniref:DUF4283 domain-containing protein n=1 Tax=Microthlaspi erraticum TaxID=1685480 RepID=A0A6D2JZK1_9BRAS|nr:unnamed protein product [Microthlaspi erraticum]